MFRDLKEYQEITKIYQDSVHISEEERIITRIIREENFTQEELDYVIENFDEIYDNQILTEEFFDEMEGEYLEEMAVAKKAITTAVKKVVPKAKKVIEKGVKQLDVFKDTAKTTVQNVKPTVKKSLEKVGNRAGESATIKPKGLIQRGKDAAKSAVTKLKSGIKKVVSNPTVQKVVKGVSRAVPGVALGAGLAVGAGKLLNKGKTPDETKITPPPQIGGGNAGGSTDSGGTQGQGGAEIKPTPTETKPVKKMHSIEKKNRARFGDAHVDKLKAKNVDFKAMRKGTMSKDDFIKKYPKSITAQKAAGLRDHTEWDAYDMVLEYLFSTEQVASLEEANYVMMEMDQETIGSIVSEVKNVLDEGIIDNLKAGAKKVGSLVQKGVDRVKAAAGGVKDKVEKRVERRKENVAINTRIKEKQSGADANSGKTKAQVMALNRKKEKLNNPKEYAKKQAMSGREKAQALAKARIAAKEKANQPRGRVR